MLRTGNRANAEPAAEITLRMKAGDVWTLRFT
jgi:hypothetical protein